MAQEQKQKLLDREAYRQQLNKSKQRASIERQQAVLNQKMAELEQAEANHSTSSVKKSKSHTKILLSILILLILALLPYPKVIVYEKLGVVAQSIYVPSRFGSPSGLLDSHSEVRLDNELRWLYLCDTFSGEKTCNRYDIVETQGFFSAVTLYFEQL